VQREFRQRVFDKFVSGEYELEVVPTCLCGSSDVIPLSQSDRFGLPVGFVLCGACGLARTTPRLASSHLPAFYEADYHGLHQSVRVPTPSTALVRSGQGKAIAAYLATFLSSDDLRVAEIGCGSGQVLREFAAVRGNRDFVAGCEYSDAFVKAGRSKGTEIRHGGAETLRDLAPFDLIIMSHVVEHLPDPVAGVGEIRQLGNHAALCYVEVPGILSIDRKREYAFSLRQYLTIAHLFHFTRQTLAWSMALAGMEALSSDEEVRGLFRSSAAKRLPIDRTQARRVLESLVELQRPSTRVRRIGPLVRQWIAATLRRLPEGTYATVRRTLGR
jgi:SAM-dependent methyltransferase